MHPVGGSTYSGVLFEFARNCLQYMYIGYSGVTVNRKSYFPTKNELEALIINTSSRFGVRSYSVTGS